MAIPQIQLLSAADASTDKTSVPIDFGDQRYGGIQVYFSSGTLNGTLVLQASLDGTNFADIPGSSQTVTAGSGFLYDITSGYNYCRVKWTRASGTGTITAIAIIKTSTHSR